MSSDGDAENLNYQRYFPFYVEKLTIIRFVAWRTFCKFYSVRWKGVVGQSFVSDNVLCTSFQATKNIPFTFLSQTQIS